MAVSQNRIISAAGHRMREGTYHEVTSSNANNTPPTGALKAAATPAAHPQVTFQGIAKVKK